VTASLPDDFAARLRLLIAPDDLERVQASFSLVKPVYARVNTLKGDVAQLLLDSEIASLSPQRVLGHETALRFDPAVRRELVDAVAVREGRLYIQSLSSQCAAPVLGPSPDEAVLDLAAAPGGKTLHLAALMENRGRLSAVEKIRDRMFRLAENLKRAGVTIARTYLMDGRDVGRKTPERFDRVLLDAPCSSEARIRSYDAESLRYWSPRKIAEQSRKQRGLLLSALQATRIGGSVLYATCSLAPEENEHVVAHALQHFDGEVETIPCEPAAVTWREGLTHWQGETLPDALRATRRILPTEETDGFYLALLRRCS